MAEGQKSPMGIAALITLTQALAATGNVVGSIYADKKVDYKDLTDVPAALASLKKFTEVSFDQVIPELDDLTGEESDQLAEAFRNSFNITDKSKEQTIEQGFGVLLQGYQAVLLILEIGKKIVDGFKGSPDSPAQA